MFFSGENRITSENMFKFFKYVRNWKLSILWKAFLNI